MVDSIRHKKDIVDAIKPHKELAELDHPDASVTTRKLKDKSVTLPKLADEVTDLLKKTYVKKTGDSMTGNLSLNNSSVGFNNGSGNYDTKIRIASNGNFDIGVTEDSANKNATSQLLLHSQNKPKWYNSANGGKVLATEEYVNTETAKYLPLDGGTMKGDINIATSATIKLQRKTGGGYHTISDGGVDNNATNLDIGNKNYTSEANLCCYNRPGWYGKNKNNEFHGFALVDDMKITSGKVTDGQTIPIPSGYSKDECTVLLSLSKSNAENIYVDIRESGIANSVQVECWADNNLTAHVGMWWRNNEGYSHSAYGNGEGKGDTWMPGEATYICIAVKRA